MGILGDLIVGNESGGDPYAKNPNSSATGAGQFINSTWLSTVTKHRPDLVEGKSPSEILSLRNDPALSKEMTEAYAADNGQILTGAGLPVTPGTSYLAHFAGPQGAVKVLQASPDAPVGDVLGAAAVKANPFLKNMTVGGLVSWADKKMGGPAQQAPPGPTQNSPAPTLAQAPSAQAQAAVAPPMFAQAAQASPASPAMSAPAASQDYWSMAPAQAVLAQLDPASAYPIQKMKIAALAPRYGKGFY